MMNLMWWNRDAITIWFEELLRVNIVICENVMIVISMW